MAYSGANEVKEAREALGKALAALQEHSDIPDDVMEIAQNIAKSVGALFEAERASSEPDGRASTKNALGSLSQTLTLLQELKSDHPGVGQATEAIAKVMGILHPLTTSPSAVPPAKSSAPPAAASSPPPSSPPPSAKPPSSAAPAKPSSVAPSASSERPAPTTSPLTELPPAPIPQGKRIEIEANIGATTQSNFYVGFSGDIAKGGVFLATYESLPKDSSVVMLVTLPGGFEFQCDGYVRFVRDPLDFSSESEPGMGIQFENLDEEAKELVLRFIRKRPPMFYDV
ncbi:MAG: PilZ domain-containing protein [Polyangiales bacterium]